MPSTSPNPTTIATATSTMNGAINKLVAPSQGLPPGLPPSSSSSSTMTSLGQQVDMWNAHEIAAFYGSYASKYDAEIDSDRTTYPGPTKIGSWAIG